MNDVLRHLVERSGGLVTRATATQVVPRWALQHACSTGHLVRVLPGVLVAAHLLRPSSTDPSRPDTTPAISRLPPLVGARAACLWANGRGTLSHLSALDVWGLHRQRPGDPLHLSAPVNTTLRMRPGVVVHRRRDLLLGPPQVVRRDDLPVTRLEQALVDSWPLLPDAARRAPVIRAVADRLTTWDRLTLALETAPRLADRAAFRALLTRLAAGCRSPLEIWGHDHVFTGPGMPPFRRQVPIRVGKRMMYLDMFAERERVDVELDGATTHGDPRQREIDLRRDALMATVGILVVRFAHRRLVHEVDAVRRETLAILASRAATLR